jgi:hypothetical protein
VQATRDTESRNLKLFLERKFFGLFKFREPQADNHSLEGSRDD